jgi:KaiC/GvpD/RAD55 family RecA-like ATPase
MRTPQAVPALTLEPGHFSTPERANLFALIQEVMRKTDRFDAKMLDIESKKRSLSLDEDWYRLFEYAGGREESSFNSVLYLERQLKEYRIRTEYMGWLGQQSGQVGDLEVQMADVVAGHAARIAQVQDGLLPEIDPSAEGIVQRALSAELNPPFPSGLEALDKYADGGLRLGEQWVFAGPPGGRKTTVALNIVAAQLKAGKHVLYIALEDNDESFLLKLAAVWSGIPFSKIRRQVQQDRDNPDPQVTAALEEVRRSNLRIYDAKKRVHRWQNLEPLVAGDRLRFGRIDLVVVDYVQAWTTSYDVLTDIVPYLLRITNEQRVAMIALSQMSNESIKFQAQGQAGGVPGVLATKGTGDLGSTCHFGVEIARDIEYDDALTLTIKKARNGEGRRQVFITLDPASGKFLTCTTHPIVRPELSQMTPDERREAEKAGF